MGLPVQGGYSREPWLILASPKSISYALELWWIAADGFRGNCFENLMGLSE